MSSCSTVRTDSRIRSTASPVRSTSSRSDTADWGKAIGGDPFGECLVVHTEVLADGRTPHAAAPVTPKAHHSAGRLQVVRALGAQLAQGWFYGSPTDDPTPVAEHDVHRSLLADLELQDVRSPFEVLGRRPIGRAPADLLHSLADEVFRHGLHLLPPAIVV